MASQNINPERWTQNWKKVLCPIFFEGKHVQLGENCCQWDGRDRHSWRRPLCCYWGVTVYLVITLLITCQLEWQKMIRSFKGCGICCRYTFSGGDSCHLQLPCQIWCSIAAKKWVVQDLTGAWQVSLSTTLLGGLNKDMVVISHFAFMSTSWMKLRDCSSFLELKTIPSILLPVQRASGTHRSVFGLKPDLSLWWLLISAS